MNNLSRGATPVRMQLAKYLKDSHTAMRNRAIQEWNLKSVRDLPTIQVFNPFDNIAITPETSPTLGVETRRTTGFTFTELGDGGDEEYRTRWNTNVNLWTYSEDDAEGQTLGPQRASAIRRRDDLTAVVLAQLLDRQTFDCDFLQLVPNTITVDYHFANPTPTTSARYFAGAQITFDVMCDEWNTKTPVSDPAKPLTIDTEVKVVNDNRPEAFLNIDQKD
jgi:hypothetical protein